MIKYFPKWCRCMHNARLVFVLTVTVIVLLLIYPFVSIEKLTFDNVVVKNRSGQGNLAEMASAARRLTSVDFEVFGVVQGVFFRKYTQKEATKLGLVGWVQNTSRGTVVGVAQGAENAVSQMKSWLERTGSPQSRIEKCVFTNAREISKPDFDKFKIDHSYS